MLAVYAGMLVIVAVVIGVVSLLQLSSPSKDRVAIIGNFLSLGTLLLALVAGIIALAAYTAATGLPDLRLDFSLAPGIPKKVMLKNEGGNLIAISSDLNIARVTIANITGYAARSPALMVQFAGTEIRADMYAISQGWVAVSQDRQTKGILAFQWDGGPNYAIHGNSLRHLPDLNLQGLCVTGSGTVKPEISFKLVADGYDRPTIVLPIYYPGMEKVIEPSFVAIRPRKIIPPEMLKFWL
jgi:hypothetical protein